MRMPSFKQNGLITRRIAKAVDHHNMSEQDSSLMDSLDISGSGPFQATRRYHKILSQFFKKMPRSQNRWAWRRYSDTFTGKEAAEFLVNIFAKIVPDKEHTIQNAQLFLTRLLQDRLLVNARAPNENLKETFAIDSTLYRFDDNRTLEKIEDTAPPRRSNSVTSISRHPTTSRRLSSSMQNLSTLISELDLKTMQNHWDERAATQKTESYVNDVSGSSYTHSSPPSTSLAESGDYMLAWKKMLLGVVGLPSVTDLLINGVSDGDVTWNCTRVGTKGIVEVPDSYLDLPNSVKKPLDILMNWRQVDGELCQPSKILEQIDAKLCCLSPLLPSENAKNIDLLWKHCHCTAVFDRRPLLRPKPGFSISSASSSSRSTGTPVSLSSPTRFQYIDEQGTPISSNGRGRLAYSGTPISNSNPFASSGSSFGSNGVPNDLFLEAAQLYLLSLPPPVRRKLHVVCRYIRRISSNPELCFDESKPNIDFMVERLGKFIMFLDDVTVSKFKEAPVIVRTLIEYQTRLFTPPQSLNDSAVKHAHARSHKSPSPLAPIFCERIDNETYSHHDQHDSELLKLLDVFLADENMTPQDRNKKLNSFAKTYPKIWAMRFPDANHGNAVLSKVKKRGTTPQARLVNRIRSLTRRDSTKRST